MATKSTEKSRRNKNKTKGLTKEIEKKYDVIIDKIMEILEISGLLEQWEFVHLSVGVSGIPVTLAHLLRTIPDTYDADATAGRNVCKKEKEASPIF